MRVYGIGNEIREVKLEDLKKAIGDKIIKVQAMVVDNMIMVDEEFVANVHLDSLMDRMNEEGSYIIIFEEEDGYIVRSEKEDNFDIIATEYKILENKQRKRDMK